MPRKLQYGFRSHEGVNDHIFDRFGGFMVVAHLMKFEPVFTKVIN